jgi:hypothetical protein
MRPSGKYWYRRLTRNRASPLFVGRAALRGSRGLTSQSQKPGEPVSCAGNEAFFRSTLECTVDVIAAALASRCPVRHDAALLSRHAARRGITRRNAKWTMRSYAHAIHIAHASHRIRSRIVSRARPMRRMRRAPHAERATVRRDCLPPHDRDETHPPRRNSPTATRRKYHRLRRVAVRNVEAATESRRVRPTVSSVDRT